MLTRLCIWFASVHRQTRESCTVLIERASLLIPVLAALNFLRPLGLDDDFQVLVLKSILGERSVTRLVQDELCKEPESRIFSRLENKNVDPYPSIRGALSIRIFDKSLLLLLLGGGGGGLDG